MTAGRALVYGMAIAGEATARALSARGWDVVVADDRPTDAGRAAAASLGARYVEAPSPAELPVALEGIDLVSPSPGVPETHPVFAAAAGAGIPVRSEIDLAWEWEQARPGGPRPMLAVTGTDGKTTTTLMIVEMLEASGCSAIDAGNTDTPLVAAIDLDVDAFVVECTSFRLAATTCFRPDAAVWLNLAEDHQDWHVSMSSYRAAKARMWRFQGEGDVAVGFAPDLAVMEELAAAPASVHRTFGLSGADYRLEGDRLVGPSGEIAPIAGMRRALPHDITNALAASALVLETRLGTNEGIAAALASFVGAPHRIQLVGNDGAVRFYDDSKATTPHAALTAIRAFDHVVLIAGGKNKGLDLSPMGSEPERMRAVVAIGAAADDIGAVFEATCPVLTASSMDDAVAVARGAAATGDVVLLSPGCASYDWYSGYPARGEDFARAVRELVGGKQED
ncbi:MAG: UDP-N-acetylmuramoyl-L-alanine--D-glutamate ligase [Acidimicrobiia bacterium]